MGSDSARSSAAIARETATARSAWLAMAVAMRPYQWPKNTIVFAALAFSAGDAWKPGDTGSWWPLAWRSGVLFALWCLAASATYLVNDLQDREADRFHPRKRFRPIAAGEVSPRAAATAAGVLLGVALPAAFFLEARAAAVLAGYVAVMAAYSVALKRVAILDILVLCTGVVARAVSGAFVIDVAISPWLYVCASFGAFFFASSKRWAEYRQLGPEAARHRPSLAAYGPEVLGQLLGISAAAAIVSYALYTIESTRVPENGAMALTVPFVAFAMFRYLLLLAGRRSGDAPDRILFTDPQVLLAIAGFVVVAMAVLLW